MIIEASHIRIRNDARQLHGLYQLEALGYSLRNPPLARVGGKYPDKLEIGVRTCPYKANSKALITIAGRKYEVGYPHVVIKPPLAEFEYNDIGERDIFFVVYPSSSLGILEPSGVLNPPLAWNLPLDALAECEAIVREMRRYFDCISEPGVCDILDALGYAMVTKILLTKSSPNPFDGNDAKGEEKRLLLAASYLRTHFMERILMDELASRFHFSRSDFFRKWHKRFGDSPKQQLNALRMEEACRLLKESRHRIGEIANMMDFDNLAYFCAAFKRRFGISPERYRREKT